MKAFQDASSEHSVGAFAEWLRANYPDAVCDLSAHGLRDRVRLGIKRAADHGITLSTGGVLPYLTIMFLAAPNFDEHPAVRRVLKDPKLEPSDKLSALAERMTVRAWIEVEQNWDETLWERPARPDTEA